LLNDDHSSLPIDIDRSPLNKDQDVNSSILSKKTNIMKRIQKAIVNVSREQDAAIIPYCEFIIASITGNPFFTTPTPAITVVQAILNDYEAALADAASRDRNKVAVKKQLRKQLNAVLNQLGNYVNTQSAADVTKIVSSGFKISKLPQPRYVSAPENVAVKPGINPGSLVIKVKKDKAANGFTFMIRNADVTDNSEWTSVTSSRSKYEFTNLLRRTEYVVKVAVIGSNEQVAYSAAVSRFTM
jgi:hypothetical protein